MQYYQHFEHFFTVQKL